MRTKKGILTIAAQLGGTCALMLGAAQAQAHARLSGAEPAPNAVVAVPTIIKLRFSEEITRKFSSFKVTGSDGKIVTIMAIDPTDATSLAGKPSAALTPGEYIVSWLAVATDDGHKTTGTYRFKVR